MSSAAPGGGGGVGALPPAPPTTSASASGPSASPPFNAYHGFIAGIFSGIAKLSVGHPFDTIKVRLQTTPASQFRGPMDCLRQTLRHEGVAGLFKGASPPLLGWMFLDSIMLGSMTFYRRLLLETVFAARPRLDDPAAHRLPALGHGLAGMLAGWTVSTVATPIEHVKARLQVQYAAAKHERPYRGPIDCCRKIYAGHGVRGLYTGFGATVFFRSFFFVWWAAYDVGGRLLAAHTALSTPAVNFWAGGLSAQLFWCAAYPADLVKQRIMTGALAPAAARESWIAAARAVAREAGGGWRPYWRGFLPCFLRAFPANGMALLAFEGVLRTLAAE
ncbi:MAG: hypothetical protein M1826_004329 [Phylliscum demangeonii]|nr:MAG: hypothetical protein M1826_004329 [Phylliscum demangeonii]